MEPAAEGLLRGHLCDAARLELREQSGRLRVEPLVGARLWQRSADAVHVDAHEGREGKQAVLIEQPHHVCLAGAHTACRENGPRLRGRADRATPLLLPPRQHLQHAAAGRRGMLSTASSTIAEHSPDDGVLLLLATQRVANVPRVVKPCT